MNNLEAYLLLFSDIMFSNLAIINRKEIIFSSINIFKVHNLYLVSLIATLGSYVASLLNYFLGKIFFNLYKYSKDEASGKSYDLLTHYLNKYTFLITLFNIVPIVGNLIPVALGFVKVRLIKILPPILLSNIVYYTLMQLI